MLIERLTRFPGTRIALLDENNVQLTYAQLIQRVRENIRHLEEPTLVEITSQEPTIQLLQFMQVTESGGIAYLQKSPSNELPRGFLFQKYPLISFDQFSSKPAIKHYTTDQNPIFLAALTSGSTGKAKALLRTWNSWQSAFPIQSQLFDMTEDCRVLLHGSLMFTANMNFALHTLWTGGCLHLTNTQSVKSLAKTLIRERISHSFLVPSKLAILARTKHRPVQPIILVTAGEPLPESTLKALKHWSPASEVIQYYGASELSFISSISSTELAQFPGSVGKPFTGVNISLTKQGQIEVKSPYGALGFEQRSTAGDYGYMNDQGYLFVTGRQDDQINRKGLKLSLHSIDRLLATKLNEPFIVLPVANEIHPGIQDGYTLFVESSRSPDKIRKDMTDILEPGIRPNKVIVLAQFPTIESGKKNIAALQKIAR